MSHVTVSINGRQVRLACSEGEEAHLTRLAGDFDKLIGELREHHGELGDARLTLMAALTVADDLAEARSKLQKLEAEVAAMQEARAASAERSNVTQTAVSTALNSAAERIENLTRKLNQTVTEGGVAIG